MRPWAEKCGLKYFGGGGVGESWVEVVVVLLVMFVVLLVVVGTWIMCSVLNNGDNDGDE